MSSFNYKPFEILKSLKHSLPSTVASSPRCSGALQRDIVDDEALFKSAMTDVKEIKEFRRIPFASPKREVVMKKNINDVNVLNILEGIVKGNVKINLEDTQEFVEWVTPSYSKELSKLLHKGMFSVQDFIDLHGYTVMEAREIVEHFLKNALQEGKRCVKIIHGRGLRSTKGAVLKETLLLQLKRDFRKFIIAYATAGAYDGGLGATYVLLKR